MRKYIEPSVKLLNIIPSNIGYDIWLKSRDSIVSYGSDETGSYLQVGNEKIYKEYEYVNRIHKMGLQYDNFPTYVFEIQGSILFRDLLFSINKVAQWAQSLRFIFSTYDDFGEENYPISSEYKDIPEWEEQFTKYMNKIEETKITDENRLEMPFSISSKYWIAINRNTLVALLSMMKKMMPFFYNIYGKLLLDVMSKCDDNLEEYLFDGISPSISQYFSKSEFVEGYNKIDDIVHLNIKMGMLLYSQFIRQTDTIIKGLYDELVHEDPEEFKHKLFYAGTELKVRYIADIDKFMRTITNRVCWFSMSSGNNINSWSNVLDIVIKNMNVNEFMDLLPCKFCDNKLVDCKYKDDVKFRGEGVEKRNLPCAILMNDIEIAKQRNDYDKTKLSELYLQTVNKLNE